MSTKHVFDRTNYVSFVEWQNPNIVALKKLTISHIKNYTA